MRKITFLLIATIFWNTGNSQIDELKPFDEISRYTSNNSELKLSHNVNSDYGVAELHGKADIKYNFYNIPLKNSTIPIEITYNSQGVKVGQRSSNVGLGWEFNTISISRRVVDVNDFVKDEDPYSSIGYYENISTNPSYRLATSRYQSSGENDMVTVIDQSPDIFTAYINGERVEFYFPEKNNSAVELTSTGYKIIGQVGNVPYTRIGTAYESFVFEDFVSITITDIDGISYEFTDYDISEISSSIDYQVGHGGSSGVFLGRPQISKWYISSIKDYMSNEIVNFSYIDNESYPYTFFDYAPVFNTQKSFRRYLVEDYFNYESNPSHATFYFAIPYPINRNDVNSNAKRFPADYLTTTNIFKKKRLVNIKFSTGFISLVYNFIRNDIENNDKALTEINVFNLNSQLVNSYSFNYNYFSCSEIGQYEQTTCSNRLKLESINKEDVGLTQFVYNETPLAPNSSIRFDYCGYFNSTNVNNNWYNEAPYDLYYYPNQNEFSVLPFNTGNGYRIGGDNYSYTISPNETLAKAGILTEIIFPTGGKHIFDYELNTFKVMNSEQTGCGLRINKITFMNSDTENAKEIDYAYNTYNQSLHQFPNFGKPEVKLFDIEWDYQYGLQINGMESLQDFDSEKMKEAFFISLNEAKFGNQFISYAKIIETQNNGSRIEHFFTDNNYRDLILKNINIGNYWGSSISGSYHTIPLYGDFPTFSSYMTKFLAFNSNIGSNFIVDYTNLFKTSKLEFYNSNNDKIKEISHDYSIINETLLQSVSARNTSLFVSFESNDQIMETIIGGGSYYNLYKKLNAKKVGETITEYFDGEELITNKEYSYYDDLPIINQTIETNSLGQEIKKTYKNVFDERYAPNPLMQQLTAQNRLNQLVDEYTSIDGTLIKKIKYNYSDFNNTVQLSQIQNSKSSEPLTATNSKIINFNSYDSKGNITEYTVENGTPVRIVWGYGDSLHGGLYPIARIENPPLNDNDFEDFIMNAINKSLLDNSSCVGVQFTGLCDEAGLRAIFNLAREDFSESQITSYTYDYIHGITSLTKPNGQTVYYEYYDNGELKSIKDEDGKKVQDIQNHYRALP